MTKLVNFHVSDLLIQKFDERAEQFGMTRTELLTAMMELVVRTFETADFAAKTIDFLLALKRKTELGQLSDVREAKSSALAYVEAYKRAKKTG